MTNTRFERISGELAGEGHRYNVSLNITVKDHYGNKSSRPVDSAISQIKLAPSGVSIPDGNYTLRYRYNGKQVEARVRTQHGMLLAAY